MQIMHPKATLMYLQVKDLYPGGHPMFQVTLQNDEIGSTMPGLARSIYWT